MTGSAQWFDELEWLAARFSGYGIGPDLAGLTLAQLLGVFIFLRRLSGGADVG